MASWAMRAFGAKTSTSPTSSSAARPEIAIPDPRRARSARRGQLYQTGHFVVMPTFHPAATIYHPDWGELLESDMRMLGAWLAANPPKEA